MTMLENEDFARELAELIERYHSGPINVLLISVEKKGPKEAALSMSEVATGGNGTLQAESVKQILEHAKRIVKMRELQ